MFYLDGTTTSKYFKWWGVKSEKTTNGSSLEKCCHLVRDHFKMQFVLHSVTRFCRLRAINNFLNIFSSSSYFIKSHRIKNNNNIKTRYIIYILNDLQDWRHPHLANHSFAFFTQSKHGSKHLVYTCFALNVTTLQTYWFADVTYRCIDGLRIN